jgi:hypothetical protein
MAIRFDTIAATEPQSGEAWGVEASHSLSEPHSSASTCDNAMNRSRSTGRTAATALRTNRNSLRGAVWYSKGWSSATRSWLNENPSDAPSAVSVPVPAGPGQEGAQQTRACDQALPCGMPSRTSCTQGAGPSASL